jgi:hypothetical protein
MWTPPQWRPGFVLITAATLALCWTTWRAHLIGNASEAGLSVGTILGLFLALALTVRRQMWPLATAVTVMALPMGLLLWLLEPASLAWALGATAAVIGLWFGGYGFVGRAASRPIHRPPEPLGGSGAAGRALIVHHPGRSGFHTAVQRAFAEGLISRGWRVDLVTAGPGAARAITDVDLLVLGAPVYNFRAARPLLDYIDGLPSLAGPPVVLVLSGGGMTDAAMDHLQRRVARAGGRVVAAYEIWTGRPNNGLYGPGQPLEIMWRAGAALPAPDRRRAT